MTWEGYATVSVVVAVLTTLVTTRIGPDLVVLGGLTLLLVLGIINTEEALSGFSNSALVSIGALFVVTAGLRETGVARVIGSALLGRPRSLLEAQARVTLPTATISAFINNTPVVAMLMPVVNDWAKRNGLSPSQFLIPLSFAGILGGLCTLIGTSTNLVIDGLLRNRVGHEGLGLFDIIWVGLPCALAGLLYLLFIGPRLLPQRTAAVGEQNDPRQYSVEMIVEPRSPLVGQTIEQAQLRHLPGLFLIEIEREGHIILAVGPQERLKSNDRLVFVGITESVVDLQRIRGLRPATDQVFKLDSQRSHRCLIEAVVSDTCSLVGRSIREGKFRTVYNAAIIAVARNGERLRQKVGDIVLRGGDTLLLEAHPWFFDQHRNSRDFYLVSRLDDSTPPRHKQLGIALAILVALVLTTAVGLFDLATAALFAAMLMVLTGCCSGTEARRSINWQVLIVIGASFGIGKAMQVSKAADALAGLLLALDSHPYIALAAVIVITMVLTELISNNAAAVLIFPIAVAVAEALEVKFLPFAIAVMIAASSGFATPIGYQTNLMVYGPGGYVFTDFLRIGLPLKLIVGGIALVLIPMIWTF